MKIRSKKNKKLLLLLISLCIAAGIGFSVLDRYGIVSVEDAFKRSSKNAAQNVSGTLYMHVIDVGQADSILFTVNGQSMLIDAGNNDDDKIVLKYLDEQGIKKLDYLVGTHPHEDHIGGLDSVILEKDIGKIYMPKVQDSVIPTTKTYEDVLKAVSSKGYKISTAKAGVSFDFGGASVDIISPIKDYTDLNNYSAVLKITFGDTVFLMMGDAEEKAEKDILQSGADVRANVLKTGHHGSNTSTGEAFFKAVSPEYAIICCGRENSYGHPGSKTLDRLKKSGITYKRTDTDGTFVIKSDSKTVSIEE